MIIMTLSGCMCANFPLLGEPQQSVRVCWLGWHIYWDLTKMLMLSSISSKRIVERTEVFRFVSLNPLNTHFRTVFHPRRCKWSVMINDLCWWSWIWHLLLISEHRGASAKSVTPPHLLPQIEAANHSLQVTHLPQSVPREGNIIC